MEQPGRNLQEVQIFTAYQGTGEREKGDHMHLIQLLLPLFDNDGHPFPQTIYLQVRDELAEHFGGITTYVRSPAEGLWKEGKTSTVRDEIVIYEVMAKELDRSWWKEFRERLELLFRQESLVVRASHIDIL